MAQATFSTTKKNVLETLGKPKSREAFGPAEKEIIKWACGCSFDETDRQNGSGVLFACEKHAE